MHDFQKMLKESNVIALLEIINRIYRHYFGDDMKMKINKEDIESQKLGVDRKVITQEGDFYYVEEKIRPPRRNGRVYQDILLEYLSSKEHGTPGWVCKPLKAHWILYINLAHQHAYLLPVFLLQKAWDLYHMDWVANNHKEAKNHGYTTVSTAVAVDDLFIAMGEAAEYFSAGEIYRRIMLALIYPFDLTPKDKLDLLSIKYECLVKS